MERITQTALQRSNLNVPIRIIRAGQLCGATRTGIWNTADMYPILIATSFHPRMRCFPTFRNRSVDWVPVDVAASCISELILPRNTTTNTQEKENQNEKQKQNTHDEDKDKDEDKYKAVEEPPYTVHNITNPHPIPWPSLLSLLQSKLPQAQLKEIPIKEWVRRLTRLADEGVTGTELPGLRLLGFFERLAEEEVEGEGGGGKGKRRGDSAVVFETMKTRERSPALRDCGPVCEEWIGRTVDGWRGSGFLRI